MRYDTPIYIRRTSLGTYNSSTGNYASDTVTEEKVYVNLQEAETEWKNQELGFVAEDRITITFQHTPSSPFASIRYGEKVFLMETAMYPKSCKTFVLKEVK